jgi:alpha-beta hydrolase superfamily lysophospholipase
MKRSQNDFITKDKVQIQYRSWIPDQIKAIVLVIHGIGSYSAYYEDMATYLAQNNIGVYGIDLRGFGNSIFNLERLLTFSQLADDINCLRNIIKENYQDKSIYIIGESLGGVVGLNYAILYKDKLDGLILVSPAIVPYMSVSFLWNIIVGFIKKSSRNLASPYPIKKIAADKEFLRKIGRDPLYKIEIPLHFGRLMWEAQKKIKKYCEKITIPVLVLQSKKDKIVHPKGAKLIYQKIRSIDKQIGIFQKSYHALLNDIEKQLVFDYILKWIKCSMNKPNI